ncbi:MULTISPECIES: hypothetical protein [Brevibacillus]|uniref:hypothetical protein n=1 Tax=Brevibacillus TaxID=55080 RepID=UPI000A8934C3|nr:MULTISPECIES: hypothetical protein [Brevibacillus]MCM3143870.1 hypothetical protein [Brevibacillus sp. MER 51]MED1918784.1 hypothetical protein [Bacillus thuringiensis]
MGRHLKQTDLAQLRASEQAKVNTELQSAYEAIAALHETVEVLQKEVQTLKGGEK